MPPPLQASEQKAQSAPSLSGWLRLGVNKDHRGQSRSRVWTVFIQEDSLVLELAVGMVRAGKCSTTGPLVGSGGGGQRGPEQLDQGGVSSTCTGGVARRAGFQGHVESECLWRGPVVRAQTCGSGQGQRGKETGPGPSPGASRWTGGGNETESESRGWGEPEGGARAKGGTSPGGSRRERHRKPRPDRGNRAPKAPAPLLSIPGRIPEVRVQTVLLTQFPASATRAPVAPGLHTEPRTRSPAQLPRPARPWGRGPQGLPATGQRQATSRFGLEGRR